MSVLIDLTGKQFGRLRVIRRMATPATHKRWPAWECICVCGNLLNVMGMHLRTGHTKSCGCLNREHLLDSNLVHGHAKARRQTSEYRAYHHAKERCENPKDIRYPRYGGRGIKFIFADFQEFIAALGTKPNPWLTLDRINNDGHYEAGNVRWATRKEQAVTSTSVKRAKYHQNPNVKKRGRHTIPHGVSRILIVCERYIRSRIENAAKSKI